MPIKKDKRKKKITLLKQKQKQTQTQKVVINLADLVKRRPRAKPLVEPIPKKPSEMILTRVIREPAFIPPYQHHINEPVKVSHAGLVQPKYIPQTYKAEMNREFLEKMGQQPTPLHRSQDIEVAEKNINPVLQEEPLIQIQRKPRATKAEMEQRSRLKKLEDEINRVEMDRRRERERILLEQGGYKSEDDERPRIPTTAEGFRKLQKDYKAKNLYK
jgi:hypothetical protein